MASLRLLPSFITICRCEHYLRMNLEQTGHFLSWVNQILEVSLDFKHFPKIPILKVKLFSRYPGCLGSLNWRTSSLHALRTDLSVCFLALEAFLLYPGHVENVRVRKRFFQTVESLLHYTRNNTFSGQTVDTEITMHTSKDSVTLLHVRLVRITFNFRSRFNQIR